jgi:putative membrane protein
MEFSGVDGFLGTRASIMLDVVFLAMFAVVPVMVASIALARYQNNFTWHKRIQLTLAIVLAVAVLAFEIDMRFFTNWAERAAPSPYFNSDSKWTSPVGISLLVHLCFAIPTAFIWIYVVSGAIRHFPKPPHPNSYSARHKLWGRIAAIEMTMTALTGWVFYYLAFVA